MYSTYLLALSVAAVPTHNTKGILYLKDFHDTALRIAKNYLKPVTATEAKCTPDLKLHPNGTMDCYAFAAGDPTKYIRDETLNPSNIVTNYFNPNVSILNAIYYSEYNKFIISSLNKQRYDYALVVADKDPQCEIAQLDEQFIQATSIGAVTTTVTQEAAQRTTRGVIERSSLSYTTPFGDKLPNYSMANTEEIQKSLGKVISKTVGQSFESLEGASCTPYTLTYGIVCESTNYRKYFSKGGKVKTLRNLAPAKYKKRLMPLNMHDNDLLAIVSGCIQRRNPPLKA